MKYSVKCPPPCNYEIAVDASNDDEAVEKLMKVGEAHLKEAHADVKVSAEQMKGMVRASMKKM